MQAVETLSDNTAQPVESVLDSVAEAVRAERTLPLLATSVLLLGDGVILVGVFLVAHWLRFIAPHDEGAAVAYSNYVQTAATISAIAVGLFSFNGFYDPDRRHAWPTRLRVVVSCVSTAVVLAMALSYVVDLPPLSRLWLGAGWLAVVVSLVAWRTIAQRLYASIQRAVAPANRVLVVGANVLGREVARELGNRYQVLGYVDNGTDLDHGADRPLLGPIASLEELVSTYAANEVVIALPADRRDQATRIIARGFHRPVRVKFLPDFGTLPTGPLEVERVGDRHYIGFTPMARVSWVKRALDVTLASVGLLLLSPLFLVVMLAIKLDSPGPVFYRQRRLGHHGRPFFMLKFRSMCVDADRRLEELRAQNEASGPLFKMRRDPRVTGVGRILRRTSVDELPQLLNVLRGEMSLVGPRPPIPAEVERYEDWQWGRLRAMPGITGLWQVSGRSEVPFHDMVRLDLFYIRNWSLSLDVEILVRTLPAVLLNRGAY